MTNNQKRPRTPLYGKEPRKQNPQKRRIKQKRKHNITKNNPKTSNNQKRQRTPLHGKESRKQKPQKEKDQTKTRAKLQNTAKTPPKQPATKRNQEPNFMAKRQRVSNQNLQKELDQTKT